MKLLIKDKWKWLARDKNDQFWVFEEKPVLTNNKFWVAKGEYAYINDITAFDIPRGILTCHVKNALLQLT